jgi:NAD(P)H-hydrate epimerase
VIEAAERAAAVVLGPGLGRDERSLDLARTLARSISKPLLIDADGLNALAGQLGDLRERSAPTVLTPHAGELARLLETDSADVSAHRLARVREAAGRAGATVVLKGDDTLVAHRDEAPVAVSPGGSPALATAGTGDVLSGVIAALLAKGLSAFEAACAGVYAHSQSGWIAAAEYGADCVIATDVIAALPAALRRAAGESSFGESS